jgi:hypothetical protein
LTWQLELANSMGGDHLLRRIIVYKLHKSNSATLLDVELKYNGVIRAKLDFGNNAVGMQTVSAGKVVRALPGKHRTFWCALAHCDYVIAACMNVRFGQFTTCVSLKLVARLKYRVC